MKKTLYKIDKNLTKITIRFSDKSLLSDFYNFLVESKIYPAVNGNHLENLHFEAFFWQDDANKIIEYLKEKKYQKYQILPS